MPYHKPKEGDMIRAYRLVISIIMALLALSVVAGCGSGNKEGAASPTETPTKVGSESCTNTCHAVTKDITGNTISTTWANNIHASVFNVQCEDCHGAASLHWGVGPIPFPNPQYPQCQACHGFSGFTATGHANAHISDGVAGPDKFFFQGDAGTGPSTIRGVPEFLPDGKTPVTHARHIEECSRCHNPNQRFEFDSQGNLVKPNPSDMPNPTVSCAGCHDAHQPAAQVSIPQRTAPVGYPNFRPYFVDPATGAQVNADDPKGRKVTGLFFQPNGAAMGGAVSGTNNELSVELLCAACHTKGKYKYSQLPTHQADVYTEWKNSGHGDRNAAAFAEFSANPAAYTDEFTGQPFAAGTHQPSYPIDMALSKFGTTANTTQNQGNNVFACFKCHNGIGSLDWQGGNQGTAKAGVVFGDETVTCLTCHSPHSNPTGTTHQVRLPSVITNYSSTPSIKDAGGNTISAPAINIKGQVFLDNQPVPLDKTATATICVFCHQGRESGFTLYKSKIEPSITIDPKFITGSFFNPHYLGTAAMLWGANAYEYAGKSYSVNAAHQGANCTTCHMDNATDDAQNGGHTWSPNVASCNTASCHGGFGAVGIESGSKANPDVDNYRASFDANNYTGDTGGASLSIADSIRVLQQKLIAALQAKGAYYDDTTYPYFFADAAHTTNFTAWTPALYKAAFNLSFVVKGLPSAGSSSQANVPNASAAVHDYKYGIQLLQDSYADLTGAALPGAFRPVGTRPATVYGPHQ